MSRYVPRPIPALPETAHKGRAGRLLSVCGSPRMPGAAILVGRAAARAGAGLVALASRDTWMDALLVGALPEAVLVRIEPGELASLTATGRWHARVLGCGLGQDELARALVDALLASRTAEPAVLDADALNLLEGEPERLRELPGPLALTPHPGEAARLLGRSVPEDGAGRLACARELAERSGALVCLKGRASVVTDGERVFVNPTGNAGMATGGTGDVLAGIAGAYLAYAAAARSREWDAFDALCQAVWVHGRAGDLAAEELGRRALLASDVIAALPRAQREREP